MALVRLTLRIEKATVARAKRYGERHGMTVSHLVSQMFARLPDDEGVLTPGVRRLLGVLPKTASLEEYRRHLRKKYRPAQVRRARR